MEEDEPEEDFTSEEEEAEEDLMTEEEAEEDLTEEEEEVSVLTPEEKEAVIKGIIPPLTPEEEEEAKEGIIPRRLLEKNRDDYIYEDGKVPLRYKGGGRYFGRLTLSGLAPGETLAPPVENMVIPYPEELPLDEKLIENDARLILLVDNEDSVDMYLKKPDYYYRAHRWIFVKVEADIASCLFLRMLKKRFENMPIYAFFDSDPRSMKLLSLLDHGVREGEGGVVPPRQDLAEVKLDIKWVGLWPTERRAGMLRGARMNDRDRQIAQELEEDPYFTKKASRKRQVQVIREDEMLAETESVWGDGGSPQAYVELKLLLGGWI